MVSIWTMEQEAIWWPLGRRFSTHGLCGLICTLHTSKTQALTHTLESVPLNIYNSYVSKTRFHWRTSSGLSVGIFHLSSKCVDDADHPIPAYSTREVSYMSGKLKRIHGACRSHRDSVQPCNLPAAENKSSEDNSDDGSGGEDDTGNIDKGGDSLSKRLMESSSICDRNKTSL